MSALDGDAASDPDVRSAWVNWNPDPKVHAFGMMRRRPGGRSPLVLALCRVTVRDTRGEFDPDDPKACEDCAEFVRAGLTFEQASEITNERMRARMADPSTIACRRGLP